MTWDDASARVIGVKNSLYKGYNSYEDALHAWRQHCLGHHRHAPDFVDGTILVLSSSTPVMQPVAPTPHAHPTNIKYQSQPPENPGMETPSEAPRSPSKRRSAQAFFSPDSPSRRRRSQVPARRLSWAVTTGGQTAVVDSETADEIIREAHLRGMEAQVMQVESVKEAEELMNCLDLDTEKSTSDEE
ncbi:hypothetical protein D9758_018191 [Tetrapyrgos nigripes]|uniref:Uncharacterized protein n=1 Tax=Tetrapyrgos nigripes TaxID=182062 RepID=A0A8H5BTF3_9AGAR|nr:hypothetical protein D9758_018191 [Tetrapyrgos nigripes]